ncbi:MAG: hypothetical protein NDI61_06845 [Bdellovibrionaceae bacterium]|nr:hypothetical protein [Pseudobdellovibrionaceae bacterium]
MRRFAWPTVLALVVCGTLGVSEFLFPTSRATAFKPVIYLYPEKTMTVTVKLELDGDFTFTYPPVDTKSGGWSVNVDTSGMITDRLTWSKYPYLFWEAKLNQGFDISAEGFVVEQAKLVTFFEEKLTRMGLNPRERADFITYWAPKLQEHPYLYVRFAGDEYTSQARLQITPEPESVIRIFAVFYPLSGPIVVRPQELPFGYRRGFTVIEWGGTILD